MNKDNRIVYQIDDNILSLKDIINEPHPPVPLDLTIRSKSICEFYEENKLVRLISTLASY